MLVVSLWHSRPSHRHLRRHHQREGPALLTLPCQCLLTNPHTRPEPTGAWRWFGSIWWPLVGHFPGGSLLFPVGKCVPQPIQAIPNASDTPTIIPRPGQSRSPC